MDNNSNNNQKKASLVFVGSICLSDIPKEVIKKVESNGKLYLNIAVMELAEPGKFGDTHFISCAPKKEERVEGQTYIVGNLKPWVQKEAQPRPTYQQIESASAASEEETNDLPF